MVVESATAGKSGAIGMGLMVMASPPNKILVSGDGEADAFEDIDDYLAQFMQEEGLGL